MRRNFTRKIALHSARCTSECNFNIVKCHTVGCQMRETWKCIVCAKEFNWASCRDVKPSTKIDGKKFIRKQPEVNLGLNKGMREKGYSITNMNNVWSGMVVNCSKYIKIRDIGHLA